MKTTFLKRIEFNANNRFADEFFTSKDLAKKMKITFDDVSIALSHLHQTNRIKLVGYTKNEKTGQYLNVYHVKKIQKCLWWLDDKNYKKLAKIEWI